MLARHLLEANVPSGISHALLELMALLDVETRAHSERLTARMQLLGEALGVDGDERAQWAWGAMLHDVGKVAVPASILQSPLALDPLQLDRIRMHCSLGHAIVFGIAALRPAAELVLSHHEYWDGSGYPRGLARERIPLGARAFAVIDSYDAMVRTDRAFRVGVEHERAMGELRGLMGIKYDPEVVRAVEQVGEAWCAIGAQHPDEGPN